MNDANNATPKRFMFVCEFCADNNPEMCGFFDADDLRVAPNGKWLCASCFDEDDSCLNHYYCWNDMPSPTFESLSTPNAPVEPTTAQVEWLEDAARYFEARPTLGEDMAHWANVHNAEMCRKIAAILAVRLDEATIRKDEREKCAKVCKDYAQWAESKIDSETSIFGTISNTSDDLAEMILSNTSAIRNGGKQP